MKFNLTVSLNNAAFQDNSDELPTIIGIVAEKLEQLNWQQMESGQSGICLDSNGNKCGIWSIR